MEAMPQRAGQMTIPEMHARVRRLASERNAVILAHNYQLPEVQDVADFVGDSLGLSQQAAKRDAREIIFCGVHFMAETAAILCPEKRVFIPDLEAGCSLAATITADELRNWKREHPGAVVVSYVNTTADVKALSDYCCTSSNAAKVVQSVPEDREILFLPDMFLGTWVKRATGRENMHIWQGECHVHAGMSPQELEDRIKGYEDAEFLVHPECGCVTNTMLLMQSGKLPHGKIASTEGIVKAVKESDRKRFVIATEVGILHRINKEAPGRELIPLNPGAVCQYMKKITLPKVLASLERQVFEVRIAPDVAAGARKAIERMVAIT